MPAPATMTTIKLPTASVSNQPACRTDFIVAGACWRSIESKILKLFIYGCFNHLEVILRQLGIWWAPSRILFCEILNDWVTVIKGLVSKLNVMVYLTSAYANERPVTENITSLRAITMYCGNCKNILMLFGSTSSYCTTVRLYPRLYCKHTLIQYNL